MVSCSDQSVLVDKIAGESSRADAMAFPRSRSLRSEQQIRQSENGHGSAADKQPYPFSPRPICTREVYRSKGPKKID